MSNETEILLIRHAESAPSREMPEADWPLSPAGVRQAQQLAAALQQWQIAAVFSSPYARARATVEPYAQAVGLGISLLADLRERKLAEGRWDDWLPLLRQAWADFNFALPHCESSYDCQRRMCHCLAHLAASYRGQRLVVCSHGNAIALYLNSIDNTFGFEAWAAMKNPDVFRITYEAGRPFWHRAFTLSDSTV